MQGGPLSLVEAAAAGRTTAIATRLAPDKCVDIRDESTADGTPAQLWACRGSVNQQFTWHPTGELRVYDTMCLEPAQARAEDGTGVVIRACRGAESQRWTPTDAGEIKAADGRCLDLENGDTRDHARIAVWSCHGGANQKWNASPAPADAGVPPDGVAIRPGESIQARVNAMAPGTQFVLKAGVHREQSVTPKEGNSFVGEPGAVMAGARLLTSFTRQGAYWVADGQTQESGPHGSCTAARPRCNRAHDLFLDGAVLRHVGTLAEVVPGAWYFDYPANRIYMADDPDGHTVETSVTAQAFAGPAGNVTVRGIVIEKYANPAQTGAVDAGRGAGWVVRDNEVRYTHGAGIRIGHRAQIVGNNVHHNGQLGVGGVGDDALVEGNTIAYNNAAGYDPGWEGGGTKFAVTRNLVVRNNHVHHNVGAGLWTDIDNIHTLYEGNRVEDNESSGIFHEISYDAVIRNNVVRRNGFAFSGWLYGAGILISSSSNVEVVGNTVEDNAHGINGIDQQRGAGRHGPWVLQNLYVHHNEVRAGDYGKAAGIAGDVALFTPARSIRYENNTYFLGRNVWPFEWNSKGLAEAGWRGVGQDAAGTFVR